MSPRIGPRRVCRSNTAWSHIPGEHVVSSSNIDHDLRQFGDCLVYHQHPQHCQTLPYSKTIQVSHSFLLWLYFRSNGHSPLSMCFSPLLLFLEHPMAPSVSISSMTRSVYSTVRSTWLVSCPKISQLSTLYMTFPSPSPLSHWIPALVDFILTSRLGTMNFSLRALIILALSIPNYLWIQRRCFGPTMVQYVVYYLYCLRRSRGLSKDIVIMDVCISLLRISHFVQYL